MTGFESNPAKDEGPASSRVELSDFLLRACHDLRAPIRAIRAHGELVLKDGAHTDPNALQERVAFIVEGAKKLELLADGLSKYSIAMRTARSEFRPTNMGTALRGALAKISREVNESGAEVTYGSLPTVAGSGDRLAEVFEILLLNAIRHSGAEHPQIHVSAEERPGAWEIRVEDNGRGVDASYLEKVFKPFERLGAKKSQGPGMGLAISREIVERHGGRMWAESQPGKGGMFGFTIPAEVTE